MPTHLFLKPGCTFHPFHNGSALQDYILRTPDQRQFRISESAYAILNDLNQGRSLEQIYASREDKTVSFPEFYQFVVTQYRPFLLEGSSPESPAAPIAKRMKLLWHHTLISQAIVVRLSRYLSSAYRPLAVWVMLALIAVAHGLLYQAYAPGQGAKFHPSLVLVAVLFSVVVHEFGHSSAVFRFGGTPGSIGVGLYILLPVLYADVSQVWTFRQRQRVVVDLGGIFFQQIVFAGLAFASVLAHDPSLRAACISIDVMTLVAINPVFRFDGYWVLVDWLGVPDLHRQAGSYLKQWLRSLLRLQWLSPQHAALNRSRFKAAIFLFYGIAGNLLLAVVIVLNLRWMQSTFTGLVRHAPALWMQAQLAITRHQVWSTIDLLTALFFLLASGLTLLCALWLRGREMLSFRPRQ